MKVSLSGSTLQWFFFPSLREGSSKVVLTSVCELILIGMTSTGRTWEPRYRLWGFPVKLKFFKD